MTFDVILLSNAHNKECLKLTKDAILSLKKSKVSVGLNIVVVEQQDVNYKGIRTLHYNFPFHYHKCMNYAIKKTRNKYVVMCNNDLIFHPGWADRLLVAFKMGYRSLSPYCNNSHKLDRGNHLFEGYQVGVHLAGWCIAAERSVIRQIGGLNEDVEFWYSDNIYAEQIKKAKIKHALVCNSFVDHVPSRTLLSLPTAEKRKKTSAQKKKYQKALKKLYAKAKTNTNRHAQAVEKEHS